MASNPYTDMQAQALTAASNNNLATNIMPGINSGAQAAGQYGGSRQGIAQGVAAGQAQTGLNSALAGLYAGNYATDTNAGLQQQSINNTYSLGQGNLDATKQANANSFTLGQGQLANSATANNNSYRLGVGQLGVTAQGQQLNYNLGQGQLSNAATAQNQNFYSQQRAQDLNQYQLGSNLFNAGVQGNIGLGAGMYNTGQTYQNAPLTALQQYGSTISPYTGYGQSNTTTGSSSTAANVLGGASIGNALGNSLSSAWNGGSPVIQNSSPYANYGTNYNALGYQP